jgi:hypothetical protein
MRNEDTQEKKDPNAFKKGSIQLVERKGKIGIDQRKAAPTNQLEYPVCKPFPFHMVSKLTKIASQDCHKYINGNDVLQMEEGH